MADHPQKTGLPRDRPLSPHLTIYHWPVTMATSITHRLTGIALSAGAILLAWWLVSISSGPESYDAFIGLAASPLGQVILFGFAWSLAFHLLNGIRHLAWDIGYGFPVKTANATGIAVILLSLVSAIGVFIIVYAGHAGFLR